MSRALVALAALVLLAPHTASAVTIDLAGALDGSQANAGVGTGSTATGSVSITLDDQTLEMTWSASFSGLLGDYTVAHFHGPALANQNAGVQVGVAFTLSPDLRSGTGGGTVTLSASQASDLLAGLWYLNVHSTVHGGGEIRGNVAVVPEPTTAVLFSTGLLCVAGLHARRRSAGSQRR
jgi:hypothetical protein